MSKKIINKENGELTLNGFTIGMHTKQTELFAHFGKDKLKKSIYTKNDYYYLPQQKVGRYYIIFSFEFNKKQLSKIKFEIETKPKERQPWGNNRDVETRWIARQMDDKSNFIWNMNIPRNYSLQYPWGFIGVYYDFKNGTFDSGIFYNKKFKKN